jgi:protein gp37
LGDKSKIEWTDATWNPVRGCSLVSAGCTNCYAMKQAHRFKSYHGLTRMTEHGPVWTGDVRLVPELLDQPLRWKRPRRIFVNSMSDLFHENVPDEFIDRVVRVMAQAYRHTFQILTKRPERMRDYLQAAFNRRGCKIAGLEKDNVVIVQSALAHQLPNVWFCVSIEDQPTAEARIPILLETPAAVRGVSAEPLLGPIELVHLCRFHCPGSRTINFRCEKCGEDVFDHKWPIDWLVAGGESGPRARPTHPNWIRSLRDQCQAAGVPFFFKQWGGNKNKKAAGAMLDGREWREFPSVFPAHGGIHHTAEATYQ